MEMSRVRFKSLHWLVAFMNPPDHLRVLSRIAGIRQPIALPQRGDPPICATLGEDRRVTSPRNISGGRTFVCEDKAEIWLQHCIGSGVVVPEQLGVLE